MSAQKTTRTVRICIFLTSIATLYINMTEKALVGRGQVCRPTRAPLSAQAQSDFFSRRGPYIYIWTKAVIIRYGILIKLASTEFMRLVIGCFVVLYTIQYKKSL